MEEQGEENADADAAGDKKKNKLLPPTCSGLPMKLWKKLRLSNKKLRNCCNSFNDEQQEDAEDVDVGVGVGVGVGVDADAEDVVVRRSRRRNCLQQRSLLDALLLPLETILRKLLHWKSS